MGIKFLVVRALPAYQDLPTSFDHLHLGAEEIRLFPNYTCRPKIPGSAAHTVPWHQVCVCVCVCL